jgi:2'-5' RNA ligase
MTDSPDLPDGTTLSVSRVFIGIHLPETVSKIITEEVKELNPFGSQVRFLPVGNHHITLHFFSSIQTSLVPKLICSTEGVAKATSSFQLTLGEPGFFPQQGKRHLYWWGITPNKNLMNLRDALTAKYREPDLPNQSNRTNLTIEREHFKPHITVARIKSIEDINESRLKDLEKNKIIRGKSFECSEIKLFKSPAGPDGYEVLKTFPLKS